MRNSGGQSRPVSAEVLSEAEGLSKGVCAIHLRWVTWPRLRG
jgi:hypothetical protein